MFSGFKFIDCNNTQIDVGNLVSRVLPSDVDNSYLCLSQIISLLEKSPTAVHMIKEAMNYNFKVVCAGDIDTDVLGFHEKTSSIILPAFLDRDLKYKKNLGEALLVVAEGFRRALKLNQAHMVRFDLEPLEYLRLVRLVEADIDAVTVQIAWELRTAGEPDAWRQLISGEKGDLAVVYSNALKKYPIGQYDGRVLRYVFRQWFADSKRINSADHVGLEMMDMALAHPEYFECGFDQHLTKNDLRLLQKNLPFENYLENINVFGKWFDGLKDPFNQAHLHHILQDMKAAKI